MLRLRKLSTSLEVVSVQQIHHQYGQYALYYGNGQLGYRENGGEFDQRTAKPSGLPGRPGPMQSGSKIGSQAAQGGSTEYRYPVGQFGSFLKGHKPHRSQMVYYSHRHHMAPSVVNPP